MQQRGFTMIELIVTMMLIGILAIAVVPRMDLLRGWDGIGYRDKLRSTLEYARKLAVAQRRNVRIEISSGTVTVTVDDAIPEASVGSYTRTPALPGSDSNSFALPSGVTAPADTTLIFDPLGRPSAAASLTVAGVGTITVEAETGYVH